MFNICSEVLFTIDLVELHQHFCHFIISRRSGSKTCCQENNCFAGIYDGKTYLSSSRKMRDSLQRFGISSKQLL